MKQIFRSYDRKLDKQATNLITVSNYTKDRIADSSYIHKNIDVIYNGINVNISNKGAIDNNTQNNIKKYLDDRKFCC